MARFLLAILFFLALPAHAEDISVISDINNTMRADGAVPDMPAAYQRLAAAGAVFHYVSFATWAEQDEINAFVKEAGFPEGKLHLRDGGGWSPATTKPPAIKKILADEPQRVFILIGDSGAEDPEIYGDIAREYKTRIRHIYIRNITDEKPEDARFKKVFRDIDTEWTLFDDPAVIGAQPNR